MIHVQIDVGDSKSTARAAEALKEAGVTGQLDCLVNNAGVLHNGWTQQDWDATMTTNVRGAARSPGLESAALGRRASKR